MNLRRRWSHLRAAFSRQASAGTALGEMGLLGPAGIGTSPGLQVGQAWARSIIASDLPPDRGLIR